MVKRIALRPLEIQQIISKWSVFFLPFKAVRIGGSLVRMDTDLCQQLGQDLGTLLPRGVRLTNNITDLRTKAEASIKLEPN